MRRVLVMVLLMGCPAGGPGGTGGATIDGGGPDPSGDGSTDGLDGSSEDNDSSTNPGSDADTATNDSGNEGNEDAGPLSPEEEACDDGLDQDLDGRVDEDCACMPGSTQPCFRGDRRQAGLGVCTIGMQLCQTTSSEFGAWGECAGDGMPSDELCSTGVDEDCDANIDEGCECFSGEERECYPFEGTPGTGACQAGTELCTDSMWGECTGAMGPSEEVCDGSIDEDCDGMIDEGCDCTLGASRACYGAATGRGVGECREGTQQCVGTGGGSAWGDCEGDTFPAAEVCSGGRDEDCDGLTDCADPDCTAACCTPYDETVPVVPPDADVLFIVDRSGSMNWPAEGTSNSRWTELRSAMDAVLPSMSSLDLGLLTFPLQNGTTESGNCSVSPFLDVNIGAGHVLPIQLRLITTEPRAGDTPTPDAFGTASAYFTLVAGAENRFVILATDGLPEPNCGATVPATETAIANLRTIHGVDTFVLGIVGPDRDGSTAGIPALRDALNRFADAGGRPRAGGGLRYYEATDAASMASSVRAILAAATGCEFRLPSAPPGARPIVVRQNRAGGGSTTVPAGQYTLSGRNLRFTGAACNTIRAGDVVSVEVDESC